MAKRIKVGVIFGGRSGEHEVSLVSATSVMKALNRKKYQVVPIGITKDGKWLTTGNPMKALKQDGLSLSKIVQPVADPTAPGFLRLNNKYIKLDVVIPVLHGTFGEDGTIQGLFELASLPYVGAGVIGSSVGMDKVISKQLFKDIGLKIVKDLVFFKSEWLENKGPILRRLEKELKYPMFVKPVNLGSSVGISKAHNRKELVKGINEAVKFDRKIIVEQGLENIREIECAVLGNDKPKASVLGEIIASNEFYDYDAKYVDGKSESVIPAKLAVSLIKKIQKMAVEAFRVLDLCGMARVDFMVTRNNSIYINEVNTIPGFTSISMYPKLWQASGLTYSKLLDQLIKLALQKNHEKNKLNTSFTPKKDWHKNG